jgi:Ca-activated chloride channel family protein
MRLLLPISASLLLAWQTACAQSADDYFNGGAHAYITNNIPEALKSVETGLKQYPDDVKLKKLYELLKQQGQQQQQDNQSQQNQNQRSQPNQSQQQQSQKNQQNQQNQQQQQQSLQNQGARNQSGQQNQTPPQQPQASNGKQGGEKQENQSEQGQPLAAGQMSPEAAKRLLDAQKGDEQFLQLKPEVKPRDNQRPIKDW